MSDKTIVYPMQATPGVIGKPDAHWPQRALHWQKRAEQAEARVAELEGQLADWKHSADNAMDERHDADEHHCTCVPVLRAKIKELEPFFEQWRVNTGELMEVKIKNRELEEKVRVLRNELSLISHLHPGPGEPGSIARRALAATESQ